MINSDKSKELELAAFQTSEASRLLLNAAVVAADVLKERALEADIVLKVDAATRAASVVSLAAVEADALVRRASAAAAVIVSRAQLSPLLRMESRPVHRIATAVSVITLVVAVCALVVVAWWLFSPYAGFTKFTVVSNTKTVPPGGLYQWTVSYCVDANTPLPIRLDREVELQNHQLRYPLPELSYVVTVPCETFVRSALLPEQLPPGEYRLQVATAVQVNPIRVIRQAFEGDVFTVTKGGAVLK